MSRVWKSASPPTEIKILPVEDLGRSARAGLPGQDAGGEAEQARVRAASILADAEEMAQTLMEKAKEDIRQRKSQAEQEIAAWWEQKQAEWREAFEEAKSQGYQEGFRQGREAGLAAAEQEYRQALQTAAEIVELAHREKERIIAEAEPFLLTLSVEIAKKVLQQELRQHPEVLLEMVRHLLARAKERSAVTICVHPGDYLLVQNHRRQLLAAAGEQAEVKIIPDPSVGEGGCILRTPQGSLDARLDTQLEEIQAALLALAEGEEDG